MVEVIEKFQDNQGNLVEKKVIKALSLKEAEELISKGEAKSHTTKIYNDSKQINL